METAEVEFIAECYKVKIVPKFNHAAIHLISGKWQLLLNQIFTLII